MLHLAQVQKQKLSGKLNLRLLAVQEAEYTWVILTEEKVIPPIEVLTIPDAEQLHEGLLVLLDLSPTGEIKHIENATNWVLDLIKTYLTTGITPAFLQQETERAEQWRQTLTLQTQELARRSLEVEARREQIQALEESLKREREGEN
ncbi:hypothetical protein [Gloeocapsopsis dulcis]|uniref:Uncharacterized protein n=1 Tax=Gloeocapsopsis dulcis AAB1 = 1H9 TaxID=1433147 RepID=A0A6N8G612_9CHRO|nr:hypothetical protein [Gloeocapsopsis dulcis]MUL39367.1 hypothetical protein [Gloeocapsopsis dulcis AAB1 = 1H9]WNN88888.1 hypothetical protein P0S91_21900 [Gloeocapsopsis dulcis]